MYLMTLKFLTQDFWGTWRGSCSLIAALIGPDRAATCERDMSSRTNRLAHARFRAAASARVVIDIAIQFAIRPSSLCLTFLATSCCDFTTAGTCWDKPYLTRERDLHRPTPTPHLTRERSQLIQHRPVVGFSLEQWGQQAGCSPWVEAPHPPRRRSASAGRG